MRWTWTTNDRWAGHPAFPPIGLEPLPTGSAIGPALPLAELPMLPDLTWRNVAILIVAIAIASGCIAWGIVVATDQSGLHKAAVTQKVLPLNVGRGAPID